LLPLSAIPAAIKAIMSIDFFIFMPPANFRFHKYYQ
jgi:hypothetical protein